MKTNSLWAVTAVLVAITTCAHANVVKKSDFDGLTSLYQKSHTTVTDIASAGETMLLTTEPAIHACMLGLSSVASNISSQIEEIGVLLALSAEMKEKSDEQLAVAVTKSTVSFSMKYFESARDSVNTIAGSCSNNSVVASKAQSVLTLLDEVTSFMTPLAARLERGR
jgi:hypothetical protein